MNSPDFHFKTHSVSYSPERARQRVYASSMFMLFGLFFTLFVVMFRPSGAEALLPSTATVYDKYDANSGYEVKYADMPKITADYNVVLKGKKTPTTIALTGVPVFELLKAGGANLNGVNFVKVRVGGSSDKSAVLLPLDQASPRPALVLDSGRRPGIGPFPTPSLVPGQPTSAPIFEKQMVSFDRRDPDEALTIIPGKPDARMMSVKISSKKTKAGEYKLTAKVSDGGTSGNFKYEWYAADSDSPVSKTSTYTTNNATSGTRTHSVKVVVTEASTGSTGARSFGYTSRKADDGKTTDPFPNPKGSTGTTGGTGPGTNGGNGSNGVIPQGLASPPGTPSPNTPQITPSPTEPTTTPEVAPPVQSDQDTSAITNAAQNTSGTGGLQTISGVLLSSPTIAPTSGGGGSPITELPAPVATELNTIFQPVEDPGDIWPYLLAILFATTLAGAIRESISP